MSIYCSYWDIGWDHDDKCKRIRKVRGGGFVQNDEKPCTCGSCPIEYRGSHILPTENDRRDGSLGISAIPDHITNYDADLLPWKPFLRVHLNDGTVIIDRQQAEKFSAALNKWLEDSQRTSEGQ